MAENKRPPEDDSPEIPPGQRTYDNIWLWFILSFLISGIIYNVWGILELFK